MPKVIIGFQTTEEFKVRVVEAGKKFKVDEVTYPLNLSGFCRIATEKLLKEIEEGRSK